MSILLFNSIISHCKYNKYHGVKNIICCNKKITLKILYALQILKL